MPALKWIQRYWILFILTAVSGIVGAGFGGLATYQPKDPDVGTWRLIGLIAAVLVIVFTLLQKVFGDVIDRRLERELLAARASTVVLVNGALIPIAHRLSEVASEPMQAKRAVLVEGIRDAVVAAAVGIVDSGDARASYFPASGERPTRQMKRHITHAGSSRTDEPTSVFAEGRVENAEVWRLVDEGDHMYVKDLNEKQPPTWFRLRPAVYRTFISVGVAAEGSGFGLLTVNKLQPGALSEAEDVATMRMLAHMLACAEVLGAPRGSRQRPSVAAKA